MNVPRAIAILSVAVVISLGLNLFLAGSVIGRQFRRPPPPPDFSARLDGLWQTMPDADRPILREIIQRHREELIQRARATRSSAQRANLALHATPFEEDQARGDLAKLSQRTQEFRSAVDDTLVEAAGKISPEGREHLRFPGGP